MDMALSFVVYVQRQRAKLSRDLSAAIIKELNSDSISVAVLPEKVFILNNMDECIIDGGRKAIWGGKPGSGTGGEDLIEGILEMKAMMTERKI
eukprot:2628189-Ditylum_brightwellii.AAC.1